MMTMMGKFPHGKEAHCNGLPSVVVEPLSLEVFEERLGLWSWIGAPPTVTRYRNKGTKGQASPGPSGFIC